MMGISLYCVPSRCRGLSSYHSLSRPLVDLGCRYAQDSGRCGRIPKVYCNVDAPQIDTEMIMSNSRKLRVPGTLLCGCKLLPCLSRRKHTESDEDFVVRRSSLLVR